MAGLLLQKIIQPVLFPKREDLPLDTVVFLGQMIALGKGIKGFKQSIKRGKEQVAAAAAIADSVKSAMNGGDQAQAAEIANASMQIALMGDRTQWVQKTEQALADAGISWNV